MLQLNGTRNLQHPYMLVLLIQSFHTSSDTTCWIDLLNRSKPSACKEGKALMVEEDIQATHRTKEQIRQEEAGLEEAIKLQAQMDEEVAKQIHLLGYGLQTMFTIRSL
ncbi:hypothetical protein Tco_0869723 [Tanacetum coccineum]